MPEVSEMAERVARAIQDVSGGLNYDYADFCRDAATAAIEAMLVPAPWMIDEMCGVWARHPKDHRKLGVIMLSYWQAAVKAALVDDPGNQETRAMIDAALS